MIGRMFKKWFKKEEEDVTEKSFGNVLSFRIGSQVAVSPVFMELLDDESVFKQKFGDTDFTGMVVNTILSFTLDHTKVYRLYCENPEAMVQITESGSHAEVMLFILTGETGFRNESEYKDFREVMSSESIHDDEDNVYKSLFNNVEYIEELEANGVVNLERPESLSKSMSLFDRDIGDSIEYVLHDAEPSGWWVEHFTGVEVPQSEVEIS